MHQVVCRIEQPGESYYKPTFVYLKKGMEKQFTGYFALYTQTFHELDDFVLVLGILDRARTAELPRSDFNRQVIRFTKRI